MEIKVYGEVQGVGFRRFVWSIAKRLGLKGYVRNLADGGVEIIVQGDNEAMFILVNKLKNTKVYDINSISVNEVNCNKFSDFEIL